jgi:multidrug efflux pump subunit AcrA (membrane-fusion protein)
MTVGVMVDAQTSNPFESPGVQTESAIPRRLNIDVAVASPEDLKVREGDRVEAGQVLADRDRERSRLLTQKQKAQATIDQIKATPLVPPPEKLPVPPLRELPPTTFAEESAQVQTAELKFAQAQRTYNSAIAFDPFLKIQAQVNFAQSEADQARAEVELQQRKVDAVSALKNLPPEIQRHELEKLRKLDSQLEQKTAEYRLQLAEFEQVLWGRQLGSKPSQNEGLR